MNIITELKDKYQNLIEQNFTTYEIAEKLDMSSSTVKRHLRKLGWKTRRYKTKGKLIEKSTLNDLINQNFSTYQIAKELKCGVGRINHWMKKYKLITNFLKKRESGCIKCGKELCRKQIRFCSRGCSSRYHNNCHNSAVRQKEKGVDKKIKLIRILGELRCSECGYMKNLSCLSFHHKDPSQKKFALDQRACAMFSLKRLTTEALKCKVLCLNCHAEHHNPQHKMVGLPGFEPRT